eukprot:TRINITY_DN428_c0_g1_i2.p1 TRINITY_DN428_c0_g1~~TRINITY_DN428_c0_g1_i2.p1  ORF type:complete len:444 (+),score=99.63 TRINITY_DN428_c0_g1_i2:76-1332(+)
MGIRRLAALAGLCPVGVELKSNQPAIHVLDFAALVHAAIFGHARTAFSTGTVDSDGVDIGAIDEALDADDLAGTMPFLSFLESTTTASTRSLAATIAATVRRRHAAVARPGIVTIVVLGDLMSSARDIGKNPKIRLSQGGTLRAINRARNAWKTGVTGGRRLDWNAIARFLLGADGLLLRVAEALAVSLGTVCTNGRDSDLTGVISGAVDGITTVWGNTEARAQLEGDTAAARIFVLAQAQGITVLNDVHDTDSIAVFNVTTNSFVPTLYATRAGVEKRSRPKLVPSTLMLSMLRSRLASRANAEPGDLTDARLLVCLAIVGRHDFSPTDLPNLRDDDVVSAILEPGVDVAVDDTKKNAQGSDTGDPLGDYGDGGSARQINQCQQCHPRGHRRRPRQTRPEPPRRILHQFYPGKDSVW